MLAVTQVRYVAVTANMNLIGERFFWYCYRIVIVSSVTGALFTSGIYLLLLLIYLLRYIFTS